MILAWLVWCEAAPAAQYVVTFDREQYTVRPRETFAVQVLINPVPAQGLYSFGLRLWTDSTNANISGVGSVVVPSDYLFDGPRASFPVVAVGSNYAAVKGTVEFFGADLKPSPSALLTTFYVTDLGSGSYGLNLGFFNTLGPSEDIFVDGSGAVIDASIKFTTASVVLAGDVRLGVNSPIALNRQTGLFEQNVSVTNGLSVALAGLRLLVTNVPPAWTVWNSAGQSSGQHYLLHNFPVKAGEVVNFRIQYRVPDRNANVQPGYFAEALYNTEFPPSPEGAAIAISPVRRSVDGSFLLEFTSLPNRSYSIQYSRDMTNWIATIPTLRGNGSRIQWTDYGPPKTEKPPGTDAQRYYRVILLP